MHIRPLVAADLPALYQMEEIYDEDLREPEEFILPLLQLKDTIFWACEDEIGLTGMFAVYPLEPEYYYALILGGYHEFELRNRPLQFSGSIALYISNVICIRHSENLLLHLVKYLKKLVQTNNVRAVGSYVCTKEGERMCRSIGLYEVNTWRKFNVQAFHAFPLELKIIGKRKYYHDLVSDLNTRSLLFD